MLNMSSRCSTMHSFLSGGMSPVLWKGHGVVCIALIVFSLLLPPAAASEELPFTISDYFKIQSIVELSISSDGAIIAYAARWQSLEENKTVRKVYISGTEPGAKPDLIEKIQKANSLAWIPGTHELAFLRNDKDTAQVFSINIFNHQIRQHTHSKNPVTQFQFAPVGRALVWVTQSTAKSQHPPLYERLQSGHKGIVIDSENTSVYRFIEPGELNYVARPTNTLWVKRTDGDAFKAQVPGLVSTFYWSPDASLLSVSVVGDDVPEEAFYNNYTSLGLFHIATRRFQMLANARPPRETEPGRYYSGGEWVLGENKLYIRRTTERDRWISKTEWMLSDLEPLDRLEMDQSAWREIEIYPRDGEPVFLPAADNIVYSNNTVRARRSLYHLTAGGFERAEILRSVEGSISLARFSANFKAAAFVNESLSAPPEIHVWRQGLGVERLSSLNSTLSDRLLPTAREITWKSNDGTTIQGWLLVPAETKSQKTKRLPLITFIHGGPGTAVLDEFAFYFKAYGGLWPYPLAVYAQSGMAVFIPNYRGTRTFGAEYRDPQRLDGEPIDDIISGVDYLIGEGIADPQRLGISGHSHGGWLAPLVMTRSKMFQAGSFAEGTLNKVVNYSLMPGWLNRDVHDIQYGASLYDNPARYIALSPDLHFEGLRATILFEAGAKSLAIAMMGSPKAARRADMPTEFVVYPQTGHNIRIPRLQKESATRNLDWFRFWLQGYEDPDPDKSDQYARWRKMRDEQCVQLQNQDNAPWYCRH